MNQVKPPYARFVVLSAARTGSNLLVSLLNNHEEVRCFREVLRRAGRIDFNISGYDADSQSDRALRDESTAAFLEQRIFCEHPPGIHAVGFKMHYEHFFPFPDAEAWIAAQQDLCIVHLRRRNLLRALVSRRIAEQTGGWIDERQYTLVGSLRAARLGRAMRHPLRAATALWRLTAPHLLPRRQPAWKDHRESLTLSPGECRVYFEWATRMADHYDDRFAGHQRFEVFYEDLVSHQRALMNDLQQFLGIEQRWLTPSTQRQNPEPLSQLLANYDELCEAFSGTEYASFFN